MISPERGVFVENLILASCSPRRSELLNLAGIPFTAVSPDVDESCSLPAEEAVAVLSSRKARAAGTLYPGARVLAADTLVAVDGRSLGKPSGPEDAFRMLRALSGWRRSSFSRGRTARFPRRKSVHTLPPANRWTRRALMRCRGALLSGSRAWRAVTPPSSASPCIWSAVSCFEAVTASLPKQTRQQ